jgi:hypothetical protein
MSITDDEVPRGIALLLRIKTEVTREDIEALQRRANHADDLELVDVCRDALNGDQASWCVCGELILESRDHGERGEAGYVNR